MTITEQRPNFHVSREAMDLIDGIADRAIDLEHGKGTRLRGKERLHWHMDLTATHNSCPIDLVALLAADDGNFAHDVFGIRRHINRQTGQLEDCFTPRFARRDPVSVEA